MSFLDEKVIAGLVAITDFKLAPKLVGDLAQHCDFMVLRLDERVGNKRIFDRCVKEAKKRAEIVVPYSEDIEYNEWNWRESLVRRLDNLRPDYVLFPDQDEQFGKGLVDDLEVFQHSMANQLEFFYTMETKDGAKVPLYPHDRHCKVFRWMPGINYQPYRSFARPNHPNNGHGMLAKSRIHHYCFWDKECRADKRLQGYIKWQDKTIYDCVNKKLLEVIPELA